MLTYTLNKVIKTFQIALLLSLGLLLTGVFVTTPRLILLLLFANDFVTMSLSSDRVTFSHAGPLADLAAGGERLGDRIGLAGLSFAVFLAGRDVLHLDLPHQQTLVFAALVFTGQATVYLVRERGHFWDSRPGRWLLMTSAAAVAIVCLFATLGILMAPIRPGIVLGLLALVLICAVPLDLLKIRLFRYFDLR